MRAKIIVLPTGRAYTDAEKFCYYMAAAKHSTQQWYEKIHRLAA